MSTLSTATMEGFRLLDLPAELCNDIYELALTMPGTILVESDFTVNPASLRMSIDQRRPYTIKNSGPPLLTHALALLRTCKQIHHECKQIFFVQDRFICDLDCAIDIPLIDEKGIFDRAFLSKECLDHFYHFVSTIGTDNASAIQDLIIDFNDTIDVGELGSILPDVIFKVLRFLKDEVARFPGLKVVLNMYCFSLQGEAEDDTGRVVQGPVDGVISFKAPKSDLLDLMEKVKAIEYVGMEEPSEQLEGFGLLGFLESCGKALGVNQTS